MKFQKKKKRVVICRLDFSFRIDKKKTFSRIVDHGHITSKFLIYILKINKIRKLKHWVKVILLRKKKRLFWQIKDIQIK
jgi:hypothetical protein